MKKTIYALMLALGAAGMASAQNSVPAPGSGGGFTPAGGPGGATSVPAPGSGGGFQPGGGPGPAGPAWGGPWGGGWSSSPAIVVSPPVSGFNSGLTNVVAVGYDAMGNYRALPLRVSYQWNGAYYSVTVINAWNPWTDAWNYGVDLPAYQTTYQFRGQTYNYYAVLSTGTFYFNL